MRLKIQAAHYAVVVLSVKKYFFLLASLISMHEFCCDFKSNVSAEKSPRHKDSPEEITVTSSY